MFRFSIYKANLFKSISVFYYRDVALEIVKSVAWKHALRNTVIEKGVINTPLRRLIRKMPGTQYININKLIKISNFLFFCFNSTINILILLVVFYHKQVLY